LGGLSLGGALGYGLALGPALFALLLNQKNLKDEKANRNSHGTHNLLEKQLLITLT